MKEPSIAPAYAFLFPIMCEAARSLGYCLALHGTMARDLDVVAIPWTDDAVDAERVMQAIRKSVDAFLVEIKSSIDGTVRRDGRDPTRKPHGRLAYSLHLGNGVFIDLSVMPRASVEVSQ